jgi:hypothetical protein
VGRAEVAFTVSPAVTITVNGSPVTSPAVKAQYTVVTLQPALNAGPGEDWNAGIAADLTVHFGLVEVGRIAGAAAIALAPSDALQLVDLRPPTIPPEPDRFLLVDAEERGVEMRGTLDWTNAVVTPDPGVSWSPDLRLPVRAHANVVEASRGRRSPARSWAAATPRRPISRSLSRRRRSPISPRRPPATSPAWPRRSWSGRIE